MESIRNGGISSACIGPEEIPSKFKSTESRIYIEVYTNTLTHTRCVSMESSHELMYIRGKLRKTYLKEGDRKGSRWHGE